MSTGTISLYLFVVCWTSSLRVKPNQAADLDHLMIIRDTDRPTNRPTETVRTNDTDRTTGAMQGRYRAGFSAMEWEQLDASELARRGGSSPAVCDAGNELTSTREPGGHVWGTPKRWIENAMQAWLMSHKGLDWVGVPVESQEDFFFSLVLLVPWIGG
ncbi:hypothetical protein KCV05_g9870, partial [Aureobasidium melanogenum]